MPPSIGAPATVREVPNMGNAHVQAPLGLSLMMPSQTSGPEYISLPLTSKQLSTAFAGRFAASLFVGLALILAIHSSITAIASNDWLALVTPGMVSVNQMTRWSELPIFWITRLRTANDWCTLCMSSSRSRYWRWSIVG